MINVVHLSFALGKNAGKHQGGAATQVGRLHACALQGRHALNNRVMVFNGDFGTHAADFSGEHEAIFENILGNHGVAVRDRSEQHELRLQIGGEAWMRQRLNIGG